MRKAREENASWVVDLHLEKELEMQFTFFRAPYSPYFFSLFLTLSTFHPIHSHCNLTSFVFMSIRSRLCLPPCVPVRVCQLHELLISQLKKYDSGWWLVNILHRPQAVPKARSWLHPDPARPGVCLSSALGNILLFFHLNVLCGSQGSQVKASLRKIHPFILRNQN